MNKNSNPRYLPKRNESYVHKTYIKIIIAALLIIVNIVNTPPIINKK